MVLLKLLQNVKRKKMDSLVFFIRWTNVTINLVLDRSYSLLNRILESTSNSNYILCRLVSYYKLVLFVLLLRNYRCLTFFIVTDIIL